MTPTAVELARYQAHLEVQGYCLVEGALDPDRLREVRDALVRVAAEEIANGTDYVYEDGSNQRVWVLLNKGRCFEELVQDETALALVGHLLGPGFPPLQRQRQHRRRRLRDVARRRRRDRWAAPQRAAVLAPAPG